VPGTGPAEAVAIRTEPLILDVDTGVDDALALLFALRCARVRLQAITCVSGNVDVDQVVANTLKVLDAAGAPALPVAPGATGPLSSRAARAGRAGRAMPASSRSVHGADGLADLGLPPSARPIAPESGVELLRRQILAAPEPPTLVAAGPLTNVALLLRTASGVLSRLRQLVVVGGRVTGEVGGVDDFNLRYDAEAAAAVLGCGVPLTMYTLGVFHQVALSGREAEDLAASDDPGTRLAGLLARHQARRFGARGACLGDAGAVLGVVQPGALRTRPHPEFPAVRVAAGVDAPAYRRLFLHTLSPLPWPGGVRWG
jgi:pyrimidine-specific ribonucleoside hydrolase